jgi:hypothetical protein
MLPYPANENFIDICQMFINEAPVQLPPYDYVIVDQPITGVFNRISWVGKALHSILIEGDHMRVQCIRLI